MKTSRSIPILAVALAIATSGCGQATASQPGDLPEPAAPPAVVELPVVEPDALEAPTAPEPLYALSGTGAFDTGPLNVPAVPHRATVRYDGPGTLTLWATAPDGTRILVADRMVLHSGAIPLMQAGVWSFDISAEGDWTLTIEPLPQQPGALTSVKGSGNYVSGYFTPEAGRQSYLYVHDGDGPFAAWLHCGADNVLLISVPDRYSTIVPADFTGEPCFWEINSQDSNANWSIIAHADKTEPY